jgi:hypothetical protein
MSQNRNEPDAFAETQLLPKIGDALTPKELLPSQGSHSPELDSRTDPTARTPEPNTERPRISIRDFLDPELTQDAAATQVIPAIPAPTTAPPAAPPAPSSDLSSTPASTLSSTAPAETRDGVAPPPPPEEPAPPAARRPRIHVAPEFAAPETAVAHPAAKATAEEQPTRSRSRRAPIPVPPEFLDTPKTGQHAAPATEPETEAPAADPERTVPAGDLPKPGTAKHSAPAPVAAAAAATPAVAKPASKPAAPDKPAAPEKPDVGGFNGPPKWQDHVPFDETGVLMRPEALRHKAMQAETELISAIREEQAPDDGSEAAQAQRPGFWTGAWPRRALLTAIMLLQAVLTLRNNNSAFEDESLYLYSGHLELGHLLNGTSLYTNFWAYFSGAPTLYPVAGAIVDQIGGLFAARLLSLTLMLGTTGLLYLLSRRLFGTRAALCAAALFSCSEAAVFVGGLATYDAPALFLLALAAWIVVRFARSTWPFYLAAILPAALAVGTKYAALMFVPIIILMALFAAAPYAGRLALVRPVALGIGFVCVLWAMVKIAGPTAIQGVQQTTTARAQGTNSIEQVLQDGGQWAGAVFAASVFGAVCLILLPRTHGHRSLSTARWQRVLFALLLSGTALLPIAYQAYLHTVTSLQKHVGFGLFFAAPLAGYGLVRLVGPHFHRVQLGIGVFVLTFALGMGQSLSLFHGWPNSDIMINELVHYQTPGGHYLVEADEVPIYTLRGDPDAEPTQFTDTFYFQYTTAQGKVLTGDDAYAAAIQAGYFQVVVYDGLDNPPVDQAIAALMYRAPKYRLVATIPAPTAFGPAYYYFWVLK